MARKGERQLYFDVIANTDDAKKKIKDLSSDVKELKDESGQLIYRVRLEGEKQLAEFDELTRNIKEESNNDLVIKFNEDVTRKSFGTTKKAIESGMKEISNVIKKYLNLEPIITNSLSTNIDSQLNSYVSKQEEALRKIDIHRENYKKRLYENNLNNDLLNAIEKNDKIQTKIIYEKIKKFGSLSYIDNIISSSGKKYNKSIIKSISDSVDINKLSEEEINKYNRYNEAINDKYNLYYNRYKDFSKLKKDIENGFIAETDLDKILSGKYKIEEIVKRNNVNRENGIKYTSLQGNNEDFTKNGFKEIEANVVVTPDNILNLKNNIENGLKDIKITIADINESQIEKIRKSLYQSRDIKKYEEENKISVDAYNEAMALSRDNIRNSIYKILSKYGKGGENENSILSDEDQDKLAGLVGAYTKKKGSFNKTVAQKTANINNEDVFGNFDEIKKKFDEYMNIKDGGINVSVILEPKGENGLNLKDDIESKLQDLSIKVTNIEGLEDSIIDSINNSFGEVLNTAIEKTNKNKESINTKEQEGEENKKKFLEAYKKHKNIAKKDADKYVGDGKSDDELVYKISFTPTLDSVKKSLKSINDYIKSINEGGEREPIEIKISLNKESITSFSADVKKVIDDASKENIEIGIHLNKEKSEGILSDLDKFKRDISNVELNITNIDDISKKISSSISKSIQSALKKIDFGKINFENKKNNNTGNNKSNNNNVVNNKVDNNTAKISSVNKEFEDIYGLIDNLIKFSDKINSPGFGNAVRSIEDLLIKKYSENEYTKDESLSSDEVFKNALKNKDKNGIISALNEKYWIDIPEIKEQAQQAKNIINESKKEASENPVKINIEINDEKIYSANLIKGYIEKIREQSKYITDEAKLDVGAVVESNGGYGYNLVNRGGSPINASKNSIKSAIKKYNEDSNAYNMSQLIRLVSTYNNVDDAKDIFGKKYSGLFDKVKNRIENAKKYKEAINKIYDYKRWIYGRLEEISGGSIGNITGGEANNLEKALTTGSIEDGYSYIKEKYGIDVPGILSASKDIKNVKKEVDDSIGENNKVRDYSEEKNNTNPKNSKMNNSSLLEKKKLLEDIDAKINEITSKERNIDIDIKINGKNIVGEGVNGFSDIISSQSEIAASKLSNIKTIAIEIKEALDAIGIKEIKHVEGYDEELKNLEAQREALNKQKKEIEASKKQSLNSAENIIKAAQETANKLEANAAEKANKTIAEAEKKANRKKSSQEKEIEKLKNERDSFTTNKNSDERNKELLLMAAKKTKNFEVDESSIKKLDDGSIQFIGLMKDANNEVVRLIYNYNQLGDVITKTFSLRRKFLNEGSQIKDSDKVQTKEFITENIKKDFENKSEGNKKDEYNLNYYNNKKYENAYDLYSKTIGYRTSINQAHAKALEEASKYPIGIYNNMINTMMEYASNINMAHKKALELAKKYPIDLYKPDYTLKGPIDDSYKGYVIDVEYENKKAEAAIKMAKEAIFKKAIDAVIEEFKDLTNPVRDERYDPVRKQLNVNKAKEEASKLASKYPIEIYGNSNILSSNLDEKSIANQVNYIKEYSNLKQRLIDISNKTNLFDLDIESIKLLDDGMVKFNGVIDAGTQKAKELEFTFNSIKDIENALNKNGSFNRNILSKFGLTDEQKKKIDKEYEIQLRKDEASAEIEQSKKNLDNIIEQMDAARNLYSSNKNNLNVINMIERMAEISRNNIDLEQGQDKDRLNEKEIIQFESTLRQLLATAKDTGKEFDDIEFTTLNLRPDGVVSITSSVREANGELTKLEYTFDNILAMIDTYNLSLDRSSFVGNISNFNLKNSSLKDIEAKKNEIIEVINNRRIYESTISTDSVEKSEATKKSYLENEKKLRKELIDLMDQMNISEQKRESIEKDIIDSTSKQLDLLTSDKFTNKQVDLIEQKKKDFYKLFNGLETDEDVSNKFLNKIVDFDGEKVGIREKISDLRNEINSAFNNLKTGSFDNNSGLSQYLSYINTLLIKAKTLIKDTSNTYYKTFGSSFNVSGMSSAEITSKIRDIYERKYGKNGLKVSAYDNILGSTVEYVDDGVLKRVTVRLNKYISALNKVDNAQNKASDSANKTSESFDNIGNEYIMAILTQTTPRNVRKYQTAGEKWIDGVKAKVANLTQYVTGIDIVMRAWNEIQQGFSFIQELDSSLTVINQTMSTTQEELQNLGYSAIKMGKDFGASSTEVLSAAAIYANAGETAESVLAKAKPTVLLANASGSEASTAADQIQGVIEQFNELEGKETQVVNAYEKISSGLAIDFSKGINIMSEGVQTAGSVVSEAGMKFETYAASVGKISEKTRLEGSTIGNAYKTIMARLSRSKSADEDVSEEERSNAAKAYKTIGIELYDQNGNYKDISETLTELASKWNTLTDAQRNYISEQSAGVRNINTFNALINTWQEANELSQSAINDTTFYESVQEKYMDSMQARLNSLRSSIQGFWNQLLDTDTLKTGVDLLNTLVNSLEKIISIPSNIGKTTGTGMIPSVITLITSTIFGSGLARNIKDAKALMIEDWQNSVNSALESGMDLDEIRRTYKRPSIYDYFGRGFSETLIDLKSFGLDAKKSDGTDGYSSYWEAFVDGAKNANGEIKNLGAGLKNVWSNMTSFSKGALIFTSIAASIGIAVKVLDYFATSAKESRKSVETANNAYSTQIEKQKEMRYTIDSIGSEWQKLSAGVDSNGNNISLTNDEFERYHDLCNQIAQVIPNVVSRYDEQGNAVLSLKGKMTELNAEYEKTIQQQARTRYNENFDTYATELMNRNGNMSFLDRIWSLFTGAKYSETEGNQEIIDALKTIQNSTYDEALQYFMHMEDDAELNRRNSEINQLLGTSGVITEEEFNALKINGTIQQAIDNQQQDLKDAANNVKKSIQDYITSITNGDGKYSSMDDNVVTMVTQAINNSSDELIGSFAENKIALETEVNNWLSALQDNPEAQNVLSNILGINEDTSIEDIKSYIENLNILEDALGLDEEGVKELKIQLKLEGTDELINEYDNIIKRASGKIKNEGRDQIAGVIKDAGEALGNINLYADRETISGSQMINSSWNNISKNDSDTFYAQQYTANGKTFVLTPITPDGTKILSPKDMDDYLQNEILAGTDSKNLLLGEFEGNDQIKNAKKFTKELTKGSKKFSQSTKTITDFLDRNNINTKQEINLLKDLINKYDSWSEVAKNLSSQAFDLEVNGDSLEALEANLDTVKQSIENIQNAYKESISSSGMSKESIENVKKAFEDLDGYNYDKLFESTSSGVHMNTQELAKMNAQYEKREKSKYQDKLKEEISAYEDICVAIEEANTLSEKQSLIRKRDGLAEQIQQTNELISKYEGLTNAVTKYQQALEMGEEGDVYDSIVSGYENAKELWEKGLVGTNEFKAFTQMFSSEDLSTASVDEYVKAWESAQTKITRWMTEDGSGVENFLYDIQTTNAEWAKFDGVNWDLTGLPDMETMSKNLGVSESLIDSMMKKLHDYGFTINFTEAKDNLRYMLNDAKEANKYLSGFANSGLNTADLDKLKVDAETLDKLKNFEFDISVSDPKALDDQIDIAQKLRIALSNAYGEGSEKVEYFDKQLDYLMAKRGELSTMSNIDIAGLSLGLDMEKDAEILDEIIEKLTTINGFTGMTLKFKAGDIDAVNNDLSIIEGKINALAKDENGKISLDTDGAAELLELYTSLLNEKAKIESTSNVIANADVAKLKSVAEQDAIKYLQAYQDAVNEYKVAIKINDKFGEGTIDTSNIENNVITALSNIQNAGTDVQKIFENLYIDMSKIDLSNLSNTINGFNGEINEITKSDYSGMGGSFTIVNNQLKMLRNSAEDAKDVLNDKSLNLEVFTKEDIQAEISRGEEFLSMLDSNSAGAKAFGDQLDYLRKKEELLGSTEGLNLSLNYDSNKAVLDNTVKGLKDIEKYKDLEINFDTNSIDKVDGQITIISNELNNLKDPNTGKIDFTQTGAAELMDIMIALYNQKQLLANDHRSYMNVDTAGVTASQKSAIENIQRLQNSIDQLDQVKFMQQFIPDIDTSIAEQAVTDAWKTIQNGTEKEKQVYANLGIEPGKINVDDNKINDETQKAIQDQIDPIDCEVLVNAGYDIKNVTKLTEDLDQLKEKYNVDIDIDWENLDPEYINGKIEDLKKQLEDLRGEDGIIKIGEDGYEEAREIMLTLIRLEQQAEGNVVLGVDTSQLEKETKLAIEDLQNVMNAYQELQALKDLQSSGIEIDTSELDAAQTKLDGFVTDFVNSHPTTAATVGLTMKEGSETKIVEDVDAALSGITANMLVEAGVDSTLVDGYVPEDKNATVTYNIDKSAVINFLNSNIDKTGTVVWRNDTSSLRREFTAAGIIGGRAKINGTAYAGGTSGQWGAKKDEVALVGEVSPELSVDPRTGRWELLGANGAEFRKIRKGQIIFNGKQTEEIFRNGKINSRGKAFVNGTIDKINSLFKVRSGTAYAYGSYGGSGGSFGRFYKNSKFYSNDKAEDEFKETLDWIEVKIDRLERKINELDTIATSAYKNFAKRNSALADEFGEVTKEIELQQKAYDAYMRKANSIGLSAEYMDKIKNGSLQIEDITNEDTKKKIDEATSWVEKAIEAKDAILELNETLGSLVQQNFENVQKQFEYTLNNIEHETSLLENQLDIIENKGMFAGKAYYESLMNNEQERIKQLESEYYALEEAMNEALASGAIEENSEALQDMQSELNSVEQSWAECTNQLLEYKNQMREMGWSAFEKTIAYLSDIKDESEFIRDLMSVNENDLFVKDTGRLSDSGLASGALMAQNYDVNMGLAEKYRDKIEEINKELAEDPTNTILIDKKLEYTQAMRDSISAANDEKKAIQDLISNSYDRMLEVLNKLIEKRKSLLESEKD